MTISHPPQKRARPTTGLCWLLAIFTFLRAIYHFPVQDKDALPQTEHHLGSNPWRRAWQHTPVFLPGESPWTGSLEGYPPWGGKESHRTEQFSKHAGRVKQLVVLGCLGMESYKEVVMKCPHQIQRRRDELIGERTKKKEKRGSADPGADSELWRFSV